MAKKIQESKSSKQEKATRSTKEKKKWVTKKAAEGPKRLVFVDTTLYEKIQKDVENMRIVTKTMISEKYNLNFYLSVRILRDLCEKNLIRFVDGNGSLKIYQGGKMMKKDEEETIQVEETPATA